MYETPGQDDQADVEAWQPQATSTSSAPDLARGFRQQAEPDLRRHLRMLSQHPADVHEPATDD